MPSNKLSVNLVFALAVVALGLTAATFAYLNWNHPQVRPAAAQEATGSPPPEKALSIDAENKLAVLEQMSAKDPENGAYPAQIANIYYDLGQYGKAADFYRKSLNIKPGDPNVETDLATCLHYMGQHEKALETLDKVLGYSPNFSQAIFNKGIVLIQGGSDVRGGIAVWEELLKSDPAFSKSAGLEQRINQLKAAAK
jgi:cytochrome c-type biogenesis protein CcmH/NrfG